MPVIQHTAGFYRAWQDGLARSRKSRGGASHQDKRGCKHERRCNYPEISNQSDQLWFSWPFHSYTYESLWSVTPENLSKFIPK